MTVSAETTPSQGSAPAPAAGEELSIPKWRLDEISAELRRTREELAIKNQLIMERQAQSRPQKKELNAEDFGFDPENFKKIRALAEVVAQDIVAQKEQNFNQQIGILSQRTETAELLAKHGADKAKLLPRIQQKQQEHWNTVGGFLPAEMAMKFLQADDAVGENEKLRKEIARLSAGGSPNPAAPEPEPYGGVPNASATRQIPGGTGAGQPSKKSTAEMTLEEATAEYEARMQRGFDAGERL